MESSRRKAWRGSLGWLRKGLESQARTLNLTRGQEENHQTPLRKDTLWERRTLSRSKLAYRKWEFGC